MTVLKLLLVLPTTYLLHYGITSPNARPPNEQLREQNFYETLIVSTVPIGKTLIAIWGIFETSILFSLSGYCPPVFANLILDVLPASFISDPTPFTDLTPTFLVGSILVLTAGFLRAHCYSALGRHFTFNLSIRPSHQLVTDGVYGIVRHPSYTAALTMLAGWLICLSDLHAFVDDKCVAPDWTSSVRNGDGVLDCHTTVNGMLAYLWVTWLGTLLVLAKTRMDNEDVMLEKNFGEEWRAWAKRVPYRLVPGIF